MTSSARVRIPGRSSGHRDDRSTYDPCIPMSSRPVGYRDRRAQQRGLTREPICGPTNGPRRRWNAASCEGGIMKPPPFEYVRPVDLDGVLGALAQNGGEASKILAGGQSLVPMMNLRMVAPKRLVDINRVPGLDRIAVEGDRLVIGALAPHRCDGLAQRQTARAARCGGLPACRSPVDTQSRHDWRQSGARRPGLRTARRNAGA